jgi:phosphatidate cytidylyltransferase
MLFRPLARRWLDMPARDRYCLAEFRPSREPEAARKYRAMLQRITFGALIIAVILLLVVFDAVMATPGASATLGLLMRRGSTIPLALIGVSIAACAELARLCRTVGLRPHAKWAVLLAAVLTASPWLSSVGWLGTSPTDLEGLRWQLIWVFVAIFGTSLLHLRRPSAEGAITDIAATWLLILYAGLLPSFLVLIRCDISRPGPIGAWLILAYLLVTKASDIGAYFVGSFLGRHKLIPRFSPGKSFEGAVGAILASVAAMLGLIAAAKWAIALRAEYANAAAEDTPHLVILLDQFGGALASFRFSQAIIFAVLMSVVGQVGDLLESIFKRSAHTKDSARLVPGFGGILDMVDSVFITAPVAWFLLTES